MPINGKNEATKEMMKAIIITDVQGNRVNTDPDTQYEDPDDDPANYEEVGRVILIVPEREEKS